jgi:hypothetical protein
MPGENALKQERPFLMYSVFRESIPEAYTSSMTAVVNQQVGTSLS